MWWYLDLVNDDGDGAVLIWSWGLPFLPGIARAARRNRSRPPRERPSLNVSIYERGKLDCYALQEYTPHDAKWDGGHTWRFGRSHFHVDQDDTSVGVSVSLDMDIPGTSTPLCGEIHVEGVARRPAQKGGAIDPTHDWTPLMGPASGRLNVRGPQGRHYDFEGRGYHDRNSGSVALHDLGFERWIWGRIPFEDHERIYYVLWPKRGGPPTSVGMEIGSDGSTRVIEGLKVELSRPRLELTGMPWHRRIVLRGADAQVWLEVKPTSILDKGPFYLRFFIDARDPRSGARHRGIAESCRPSWVDLDIHRPLVKMRVQSARRDEDSMWLPLFTGPKKGRITRLLTHTLSRR